MLAQGSLIDRATQAWVRATGRTVRVADHPWLDGPAGDPTSIGDAWLPREAARLGGSVVEGGGLLDSFAALQLDTGAVAPDIVRFYERTTEWRLDVWSQWCPAALPGGWIISTVFARRLRQLALPLRPLDAARGMDSRVIRIEDHEGRQLGSAWLRTLRSTGQVVYSGWYGIAQLPGAPRPSIRVAFPLPNGSITVFLAPTVGPGGSLRLESPRGEFGHNGAYLVVRRDAERIAVRRVPLIEHFEVYVDRDGTLRTDHELTLGPMPVLKLHYRMQPTDPGTARARS